MARDFGQNRSVLEERPTDLATRKGFLFAGRTQLIGLGVLAVLGVGAAVFFLAHPKQAETKPIVESSAVLTVTTQPAQTKLIDRHLSVSGSISAWDPLAIGGEVSMLKIDSINVEEGDHVKKGQVLATLNSSILRAQLAQLKAHLAADQASLKKAIQPNRVEDLNSWRAALSQAEANLAQEEANLLRIRAHAANNQANMQRYAELRKVGAVSQMDADTKATDAKTSTADVSAGEKRVEAMRFALHQAREKLSMAERGGRKEDILISQATLEETKARIAQLEAQIEQTIVRAPADGKIVKREVHLGEISAMGKIMFQMVRDGKFELRAQIPEVDLIRIKPGMKVRMKASGDSAEVLGVVREVSPAVDEKTRLGMARIDLPADAHWMKPGLFYHADIDLGHEKALVVPAKAVLTRNEKEVVFVRDGELARMRPVLVGEALTDGNIEIRSGLAAGEPVIVTGAGFMKDMDKVRFVSEGSDSRN